MTKFGDQSSHKNQEHLGVFDFSLPEDAHLHENHWTLLWRGLTLYRNWKKEGGWFGSPNHPRVFWKIPWFFPGGKKNCWVKGVDLVHLSQMVGLMVIYHPFGRICLISPPKMKCFEHCNNSCAKVLLLHNPHVKTEKIIALIYGKPKNRPNLHFGGSAGVYYPIIQGLQ